MSLQILLQQQREEASNNFNIWFKEYPGTPTIGEVEEWFISRYSTIQNQIVEDVKEKVKELSNKEDGRRRPSGLEFHPDNYFGNKFVDKYCEALSDLSSWLTEEMDKK